MKKNFSFIATWLFVCIVFSQNYKPISGMGIKASIAQDGLSVASTSTSSNMNSVIDADINSGNTLGSMLNNSAGNGVAVVNNNITYPAGYITGFNVDMTNGPITPAILNTLSIATYKNGVLQETSATGALSNVPAYGGKRSRTFLNFKTTKAFNEVRLLRSAGNTSSNGLNIYYAFANDPNGLKLENNGICDDIIGGSLNDYDTNISSSDNLPSPLSIITDRDKIADGNKSSFATVTMPSGFIGNYTVGVFDKNQYYPIGNKAGFVISPENANAVFTKKMLDNIVIETYLNGQLQESQSGAGTMNIASMSFGGNKQKLSITTTKPFNEVRLKISQNASYPTMGGIKIYYAFEEPQNCDCKQYLQTNKAVPYKGAIVKGNLPNGATKVFMGGRYYENWTGTWASSGMYDGMYYPERAVDSDLANYAIYTLPNYPFNSTIYMTGNLAVESVGTTHPAGTFAGFTIGKDYATEWSAIGSVSVQFYNGNTLVEQKSSVNNDLKLIPVSGGKTIAGFKSTKPFNRIRISIKHAINAGKCVNYYIYNAFVETDTDGDGVPDCIDKCPNGDDNLDSNGNGIPDACDTTGCVSDSDKSSTVDSDGDGIPDACDLDSDNDGIPDTLEDLNHNGKFEDDDIDGDILVVPVLGDGVSCYLDLDSDNDGVLDLFESGIPTSVINQIDTDHNGVIDANVPKGNNGLADILETTPDSGVMKYPLKNTDGDDKPDFIDLTSNGVDYDLYAIGKSNLDDLGAGFISRISDADSDGIQAVVDTDLVKKGAPNSPLSPYASFAKNGTKATAKAIKDVAAAATDIKVYPNPVKAGENLNVKSTDTGEEGTYTIFSAQGQLVKTGTFKGNAEISTSSLPSGMYMIKIETKSTIKSYKVIVK